MAATVYNRGWPNPFDWYQSISRSVDMEHRYGHSAWLPRQKGAESPPDKPRFGCFRNFPKEGVPAPTERAERQSRDRTSPRAQLEGRIRKERGDRGEPSRDASHLFWAAATADQDNGAGVDEGCQFESDHTPERASPNDESGRWRGKVVCDPRRYAPDRVPGRNNRPRRHNNIRNYGCLVGEEPCVSAEAGKQDDGFIHAQCRPSRIARITPVPALIAPLIEQRHRPDRGWSPTPVHRNRTARASHHTLRTGLSRE